MRSATVFRTTTVPSKTAFDCVSILDGDRGSLTTGAEPGGAVAPAARGSLRQVFPHAGVEEVFRGHREALRFLRGRGLEARCVTSATFRADFKASFKRQREVPAGGLHPRAAQRRRADALAREQRPHAVPRPDRAAGPGALDDRRTADRRARLKRSESSRPACS